MPAFGQPDEARRYREAKAAGSRRALQLLDQAIAEASRDPRIAGEHLAALRRRRDALVSPAPEPAGSEPRH